MALPKKVWGLKSWMHGGAGLVSTGNRELDEKTGGGHVLGTVSTIQVDALSDFANTLISYELAESISMRHCTIIIVSSRREAQEIWLSNLPFNLNAVSVQ